MRAIFLQAGILLVLTAGWGFWLWRVLGKPKRFSQAFWYGIAGFCLQALVVQFLRSIGLPFVWGTFVVWIIALAGIGLALLSGSRLHSFGRCWGRETLVLAALALVIGAGQGSSLRQRGVAHYFGRAHLDQLNYVLIAEFLKEAPVKLTDQQIGLHPWLFECLAKKDQRITQSVVHAEVEVLYGSDAQQTYGATVLVFLIWLALSVASLLRGWGLPLACAVLAGAWAGFSPSVTSMHLDGFFSQTATLFVFPALAGVLAGRRITITSATLAGILLAFLIGAYTELAPFGLAEAACLVISREKNFYRILQLAGWMLVAALALNAPQLASLARFLREQMMVGVSHVWVLRLPKDSASLHAWAQGLGANFLNQNVQMICGLFFSGILIYAVTLNRHLRRHIFPALLPFFVVGTALVLTAALSASDFRGKYALFKLETSTVPLVIAAITAMAWNGRARIRIFFVLVPVMFCFLSMMACFRAQEEVAHGSDQIVRADLAAFRQIYQRSSHPDGYFLVDEPNMFTASWLAYYLRDENVFFARLHLCDLLIPSWYPCRNIPPRLTGLWRVTGETMQDVTSNYAPSPVVLISGATEAWAGRVPVWKASGEIVVRIERSSLPAAALPSWACLELHNENGEDVYFQLTESDKKQKVRGGRLAWKINEVSQEAVLRMKPLIPGPYQLLFLGVEPPEEGGGPPVLY